MSGPANTRFSMAIHVLVMLADKSPDQVSSEHAASSVGTNPVHIRRVMSSLRDAGIVTSRSGAGGGWTLARKPDRITLDEVWDCLYGDELVVALHPEPNPACPIGREIGSVLDDLSQRVTDAARAELAGVTLADVLSETVRPASSARRSPSRRRTTA